MKLLMLCPQFRPMTGGYERAAERLSAALATRGHAVTVITERRNRAWPQQELLSGFQIERLWCLYRRGWHVLTALLSFAWWMMRHGRQHDVWHVHQYGAHATLAVLLGKLLGRPIVLKLTSSGAQSLDQTLDKGRLARLHGWTHRHISACIAVSEESRLDAIRFGIPKGRIHLIPNGVSTKALQPVTPEQSAVKRQQLRLGDSFLAVCVARLAEEKNPLGLMEAWQRALADLPEGSLLVWVGDGPLRDKVTAYLRQLEIQDKVLLVGHSDAVPDWLAAADLFLLPSRNEGMANTLLEAMACGLPSVATAVSGVPQLLGKTGAGRVVPVGDMPAFAHAIVQLAKDGAARQQMGARARAVIESHYSIDHVADQVLDVYGSLLTKADLATQ